MSFRVSKPHIKIPDLPTGTKQLSMPSETDHLFCQACRDMHKRARIPDSILFFTRLTPDAVANDRGFMPLIKAFTAFIEWTTGTKAEWLLTKPEDNARIRWSEKYLMENRMPPNIFRTFIMDLTMHEQHPDIKVVGNTGWYAACNGYGGSVYFKQRALMGLSPEAALAFMCHEFTAHAFDTGVGVASRTHYVNDSPHNGHCATGAVSHSNCLNGFIDNGYNNHNNALPFFTKWYDDHKDDPLTMYGSPTPSPAPPPSPPSRPLGSPPPPPKETEKEKEVKEIIKKILDPPLHPPPPPPPSTELAAYLAVVPVIPEEADLEEIVELD
jgi:hypothetical protein